MPCVGKTWHGQTGLNRERVLQWETSLSKRTLGVLGFSMAALQFHNWEAVGKWGWFVFCRKVESWDEVSALILSLPKCLIAELKRNQAEDDYDDILWKFEIVHLLVIVQSHLFFSWQEYLHDQQLSVGHGSGSDVLANPNISLACFPFFFFFLQLVVFDNMWFSCHNIKTLTYKKLFFLKSTK